MDAKAAAESKTKVEYVGGSVEAACALGMADGIGESTLDILCLKLLLTSVLSRSCR